MPSENILTVAAREYATRIRSKAFWITTIALPVFMGALIVLPVVLLSKVHSTHRVVLVDATGRLGETVSEQLQKEAGPESAVSPFEVTLEAVGETEPARAEQRLRLDERVLADEIDAWVWIDETGLAEDHIEYHAASVSNFLTQEMLERGLSTVVRRDRLAQAGLDPDRIEELGRGVDLTTVRVSAEGSKQEGAEAGIALSYGLFFLLYLVLMIYGQQVMTGVLEEKSNRIVEVIIATTRPFDLMIGKIMGIGCVALTQLTIWLASVLLLTAPGVVASLAFVPEGMDMPTLPLRVVVHFLAFFVIGFFLFATFYAAIGASFNNVQEAQQFAGLAVVVLVLPMLLFWPVLNDPDSTLSVISSLVPIFTPLLMLLRISVKTPPIWQIALGYLLSIGFTLFMIWLASRIYRIGILMYGKKPTLPELWRWVRHA